MQIFQLGIGFYMFFGNLCFLCIVSSLSQAEAYAYLSGLDKEIVREINLARSSPKQYAVFLEELRPYYQGKQFRQPGRIILNTQEGVAAVNEAIRFLKKVKPVPKLAVSQGLCYAAEEHVKTQGPSGATGHNEDTGTTAEDRINRYGVWNETIGENICYGKPTAREVVISCIIDDGVKNRGHRKNLFNSSFHLVGAATGFHARYQTMAVMVFAGDYKEK